MINLLLFQLKEKSPSFNATVCETDNSTAVFLQLFYMTDIKYLPTPEFKQI